MDIYWLCDLPNPGVDIHIVLVIKATHWLSKFCIENSTCHQGLNSGSTINSETLYRSFNILLFQILIFRL